MQNKTKQKKHRFMQNSDLRCVLSAGLRDSYTTRLKNSWVVENMNVPTTSYPPPLPQRTLTLDRMSDPRSLSQRTLTLDQTWETTLNPVIARNARTGPNARNHERRKRPLRLLLTQPLMWEKLLSVHSLEAEYQWLMTDKVANRFAHGMVQKAAGVMRLEKCTAHAHETRKRLLRLLLTQPLMWGKLLSVHSLEAEYQ